MNVSQKKVRRAKTWKEAASYAIGKMSNGEAKEFIRNHSERGVQIGDPEIRKLTGGYSSQSIDVWVLRKLGVKAGYIKNAR